MPATTTKRRNHGRRAYLKQFLETEFQSQGEQQYDNTQLGPQVDVGLIDNRREKSKIGPHQKTSHDIAQDHGLFQFLEQQGHYPGHNQDKSQIGNE